MLFQCAVGDVIRLHELVIRQRDKVKAERENSCTLCIFILYLYIGKIKPFMKKGLLKRKKIR